MYVASKGGELVKSKAGNTILLDDAIRNMSGDNLHAPDEKFTLLLNQSLIVKGNFDSGNGRIKDDLQFLFKENCTRKRTTAWITWLTTAVLVAFQVLN